MDGEKQPQQVEKELVPVFPDPEKSAFNKGYRAGIRDVVYIVSVSVIMAALLLRISRENF